jgi:uncharacterized protein (DUF1778 family)
VRKERRAREARLGFRVDDRIKEMVERAAGLERRSLTDFCLTALSEAARQTIARHHRGWTRSTLTGAPAPPGIPDFARAP